MKRNILFALVAMALGGVGVAEAQSGTWYIAPRIGYIEPDSNRTTDGNLYSGIGVGVWVNPNFAVDFEYAINNMDFKSSSPRDGHQWESVQLDVAGRWFFGDIGSGWPGRCICAPLRRMNCSCCSASSSNRRSSRSMRSLAAGRSVCAQIGMG